MTLKSLVIAGLAALTLASCNNQEKLEEIASKNPNLTATEDKLEGDLQPESYFCEVNQRECDYDYVQCGNGFGSICRDGDPVDCYAEITCKMFFKNPDLKLIEKYSRYDSFRDWKDAYLPSNRPDASLSEELTRSFDSAKKNGNLVHVSFRGCDVNVSTLHYGPILSNCKYVRLDEVMEK
jgi:hypothetical protein